MLTVKVVFFISSLLEEFNSNLTELSIRKDILLLLIILFNFILKIVNLIMNKIRRTASDNFFIAYNLLLEIRVNIARSLTVLTCNQILKFLSNHLVSLAHNNIEYSLSTNDLRSRVTSGG